MLSEVDVQASERKLKGNRDLVPGALCMEGVVRAMRAGG